MKILFNYRPEGKIVADKKVMAIRRGPRGLVAVIQGEGPIVIWNNDVADNHITDSEETLLTKIAEVLTTV